MDEIIFFKEFKEQMDEEIKSKVIMFVNKLDKIFVDVCLNFFINLEKGLDDID